MARPTETTSARPAAEQVADGVWAIRQPLRNAMRFVWAYAVQAGDGIVLIDGGLDDDGHWANLEAGLAVFDHSPKDIQAAIFTHYHGDHYGLADRIRTHSGAWIALNSTESALIAARSGVPVDVSEVERWFRTLGVRAAECSDLVDVAVAQETRNRRRVHPDRTLADGEVVHVSGERFEIFATPGHSPGHVCVIDWKRQLVFSGDHVLSVTTPNVSVLPGAPAGSPLDDYLDALTRVQSLAGLLALPGHEDQPELSARAEELIAHHTQQLHLVAGLVGDGFETVREVAEALWPSAWRGPSAVDRNLALGETYAHLLVLERRGTVARVSGEPLRWRQETV